jgi:alanine dehydrogenase
MKIGVTRNKVEKIVFGLVPASVKGDNSWSTVIVEHDAGIGGFNDAVYQSAGAVLLNC